ncbi:amino acid permease, partial [Shewanella algae]|uniref:amino acid permease n=1 Tax=Shewanella algae TaxID=38313 RepID=UPI00313D8E07
MPVATKAAQVALGPMAVFLVSLVLSFSALVSLNGSTLTGARIPFAMAKDRLFFQGLASVNPRTHAPVTSVVIQGSIAT